MSKVLLDFQMETEKESFNFGNNTIEVITFVPLSTVLEITKDVSKSYLDSDGNPDSAFSKYAFIFSVIHHCTNIAVFDSDGKFILNTDILSSSLWDKIKSIIKNYTFIEELVNLSLGDAARQYEVSKSVGQVIDGVVTKILVFMETLDPNEFVNASKKIIKAVEKSKVSRYLKENKDETVS